MARDSDSSSTRGSSKKIPATTKSSVKSKRFWRKIMSHEIPPDHMQIFDRFPRSFLNKMLRREVREAPAQQ